VRQDCGGPEAVREDRSSHVIRFIEMDFGCGRASSIRLSTWIGHPSPTPPPMIMRRPVLNSVCAACRLTPQQQPLPNRVTRRHVQISATPSSTEPTQTLNPTNGGSNSSPSAGRIDLYKNHYPHVTETVFVDARFEVLSSPFSLLSASISASQNLYTRKGTLVGFNGKPENVGRILKDIVRLSLILSDRLCQLFLSSDLLDELSLECHSFTSE
jgi:hypothetical protein